MTSANETSSLVDFPCLAIILYHLTYSANIRNNTLKNNRISGKIDCFIVQGSHNIVPNCSEQPSLAVCLW